MDDSWKPHLASEQLLDRAWEHVQSVPYDVSLRWLFYRLLQDGMYGNKGDYARMKALFTRARKSSWKFWRPDTLADETRRSILHEGYDTPEEWLDAIQRGLICRLDKWFTQPQYIELWFEAKAMQQQFEY